VRRITLADGMDRLVGFKLRFWALESVAKSFPTVCTENFGGAFVLNSLRCLRHGQHVFQPRAGQSNGMIAGLETVRSAEPFKGRRQATGRKVMLLGHGEIMVLRTEVQVLRTRSG